MIFVILFAVLYDYDGDTWVIKYTDDISEVHMEMIWVSVRCRSSNECLNIYFDILL